MKKHPNKHIQEAIEYAHPEMLDLGSSRSFSALFLQVTLW